MYVAASGTVLNADILRSADKPVSFEAVHNLRKTSDVDLRDGFPNGFLDSEIVVTTKPVQLHLAEGTQETVRFLAEEVMNSSSPVGRHFTLESEYSLD